MMRRRKLNASERKVVDQAVAHFQEHLHLFDGFAKNVVESLRTDDELSNYIHFIKYRLKSPDRLRSKLTKKILKSRRRRPEVNASNLFYKINDLAGVRILHLHTSQIAAMDHCIRRILKNIKIRVIEGPTAHCWDVEYERLFKSIKIDTKSRDSIVLDTRKMTLMKIYKIN